MFVIYEQPIIVHSDICTLECHASYDSRKHRDKVLIFKTGEKKYVHMTATEKRKVGRTCTIKKPSYNYYDKRNNNLLFGDEA